MITNAEKVLRYEKVEQVMMRPDLDAKEKLILMDLIMREPPPEEKVDEETGQTFKMIGMAVATDEQIAERTKISPKAVQVRLKSLHKRGFLRKKPSKGRVPNRYNVKFPHKAKKATEKDTQESTEKANVKEKITPTSPFLDAVAQDAEFEDIPGADAFRDVPDKGQH